MRRAVYRTWVLVQSAFLAVLLTWPTVLRLDSALLGSPDADTMKHAWTLWWFRRMMAFDRDFSFHTTYVNHPSGMELWPIEPLNALAAVFLWPVPLVALVNLLALVNLFLDGVCGALLGRALTGTDRGGLVAGLLLQTSAFAAFSLTVGVGELQHLWLLPLGLWAWVRLRDTGRWAWAGATGAILAFATLACFYHGFFLAVALLLLSLVELVRGPGRLRLLPRLVGAALLASLVVIPIARGFSASYGMDARADVSLPDYVFRAGYGQPITDPVSARLQPEDLVRGQAHLRAEAPRDLLAYGGGRLLGVPILVLAAVALVRRPREALPFLVVAGVGGLLALGSYLAVGGEEVLWGGRRLQLPFLYLNRALGWATEPLNFPVRFLALAAVSFSALGALAVASVEGRWRVLMASLAVANAVDVRVREILPWPLPSFSLPDLTLLQAVADHRGHGLADLTVAWRSDRENRFHVMAAQMVHQHPIQAVPLERLEYFVRDGTLLVASLKLVEDLEPAWLRQAPTVTRDYRGDLFALREAGFEEALVSWHGGRDALPAELTNALEAIFGVPVVESPAVVLYAIPEVTATEEERQAWRTEYAARLETARGADATLGPGR